LYACYAAAAQGIGVSGDRAGLPPLRSITPPPDRPHARDVTDAPIGEVRGVNVHAAQVVDGRALLLPAHCARDVGAFSGVVVSLEFFAQTACGCHGL
jgi:hypothetical protein